MAGSPLDGGTGGVSQVVSWQGRRAPSRGVTLSNALLREEETGLVGISVSKVEAALAFVTIKRKASSFWPEMACGPEHRSSVELIEAIPCIHQHRNNWILLSMRRCRGSGTEGVDHQVDLGAGSEVLPWAHYWQRWHQWG